MILLADESVDGQVVEGLRSEGHSVWYTAEQEPGLADADVFHIANQKEAVLLTADKDFGEIVFRQRHITKGVILIRLAGLSPSRKSLTIASALRDHSGELIDAFTVISPASIRIRRQLP